MAVTELLLIRHGESAGNVAREDAEASGAEVIDIEWRDADTPLSEHGRDQARALGGWCGCAGRSPARRLRDRPPVEFDTVHTARWRVIRSVRSVLSRR